MHKLHSSLQDKEVFVHFLAVVLECASCVKKSLLLPAAVQTDLFGKLAAYAGVLGLFWVHQLVSTRQDTF